jgi:type II secretory pathway pseudopilin PulG
MKAITFICARLEGRRGFILMTSYLLIGLLSVFSLALYSRFQAYVQGAERDRNKTVAFNMAEAGVDAAMAALELDDDYAGTPYVSMSTPTVRGGYDLTVTTPTSQPNVRVIQSRGYAPENNPVSRAYETRSLTVYVEFDENNLFDFAVFTDQGMQLNGTPQVVVDSYDSRVGPYNPSSARSNGDIGTNSTVDASVGIIGNTQVKGDAYVGPGGDPAKVITVSPNALLTGNQLVAVSPRNYQPVTSNMPSSGNLSIQGGQEKQLAGGTYRFDSISIGGSGRLTLLGPVTIFVDGTCRLGGNGVGTADNNPTNFYLFSTGASDVSVTGGAELYAAIFAPRSRVSNSGNATIYGAVVGRDYDQTGNGSLHFDEALRDTGGKQRGLLRLRVWNEENTAAWGAGANQSGSSGGVL